MPLEAQLTNSEKIIDNILLINENLDDGFTLRVGIIFLEVFF